MLELENVSYYHNVYRVFHRSKKQILSHVCLRIEYGKNYAIMGKSGSGKSTLAQIMCGLLKPQVDECGVRGAVRFQGKDLSLGSLESRRGFYSQVQMLFQDSIGSLNPRLSCYENVIEPLLYLGTSAQARERVVAMLNKVGLDECILDKSVAMISGGEAQRICLVRALLLNPRILILDESLSGLDYELCFEVLDMLMRWQAQTQASIVAITHDEKIALSLCGRIALVENGSLKDLAP